MDMAQTGISIETNKAVYYRNNVFKNYYTSTLPFSEMTFNNASTESTHIHLSKHTMFVANQPANVYILRDITEVAKSEQDKYFQMLIATITHELRTPLNIIMAILHFILDKSSDASIKKEVTKGLCASSMQETLINDILDMAKIGHGELKLNIQPTNIKDALKDMHDLFKFKINNSIEFKLIIDDLLPKCVSIDERRYKQVVLNLLSNSSKFTTKGFIHLKVSYSNSQLFTSVIDSGVGIEPKDNNKIFKKFAMLSSTSNMNKTGTGLGLSLCKSLVNKMGGDIRFISIPYMRTEFSFVINCEVCEKVEKKDASFCVINPAVLVMIVDDNFMNIAVMESFCKKANVKYVSF
jgi:signal transduction histidine kinase